MDILKNSLGQSHDIIEKLVAEGDTVIDATAGNGNDTVFLAHLVGDSGRVYSFDIQSQAIERTRQKLDAQGLSERVKLINDGHQNMNLYVYERVRAVMFNLGYLPGGDHSIGTRAESTIKAINEAMELLTVNGMVTIVVYYGGDSGFEEKEAVMEFIKSIDCRKYTVMKTEFINQVSCPPILVCIERCKGSKF